MNKTNKLARTAAAMAISVATGLLAAPVDAVSPAVTYALDTTSVPTLGVPIPKEMRGGTCS